ncbi:MAG: ComEC/Rec2 family competence protein [Clostridia bacterium]|nr:ComEC/Rec2 family competence protein [Clostridia bacterium]
MRRISVLFILLLFALTSGCSYNSANVFNKGEITYDNTVSFIDVGQGDSILVKSNGCYMLVDAGEEDKGSVVAEYIRNEGIDKLDYVVATHPHSDHIGGMDDILNTFQVDNIIMPDMVTSTKCFENMLNAVENKNINAIVGQAGYDFELGNFKCSIVGPVTIGDDANNNSVVIKLVYGNDSILLTGDCSKAEETDIADSGADISANLLKAGHHGSSTSSSDKFVSMVSPQIVVISCGKDNEYGHPHKETLDTFNKYGVKVYRTDEEGTVTAVCSGNGISMVTDNTVTEDTDTENTYTENTDTDDKNNENVSYILNKGTKKFHNADCSSAESISEKNRQEYTGTREELIKTGYAPCGICKP